MSMETEVMSKWRRYRIIEKEYRELLGELGIRRPPSTHLKSSGSKRTGGEAALDVVSAPPLPLPSGASKRPNSEAYASGACASGSGRATSSLPADPSMPSVQSELNEQAYVSESCAESLSSEHTATSCDSRDETSSTNSLTAENVEMGQPREESPELCYRHLSTAQELASIASKHNLTHACINDLLDFCRRRGIVELPKDARTIMQTERKANLEHGDSFVHFGLAEGIQHAVGQGPAPENVELHANIDGLPLHRSSQTALWPILCRVINIKKSEPFMVSAYCGAGKPPCLQEYLRPFIDEVRNLSCNGLMVKGVHVNVCLKAVICDAPARSFVKAITGHTGYHACERCSQKGHYLENRMTFPDLHAPQRTDSSFRSQEDRRHHTGVSPFTSLNVDMVKCFPTEYMHLVCLGVMRRLLRNWICKGHAARLSRADRSALNDKLREAATAFPKYFQRKPRGTEELDRWKATEFRTFLLYLGPVLLKSILPDELYKHFLYLHVSVRVLASPQHHRDLNQFAHDLLRYFVQEFGRLYGQKQLVYNVHTLAHLAEQCLEHGTVDEFSAFPFESYLGKVKKRLRTTNKPLAQLSRRMSEVRACTPLSTGQVGGDVKVGDCFLVDNCAVVIVDLLGCNAKAGILPNGREFFRVPIDSSRMDVRRYSALGQETKIWPISYIKNKVRCIKLQYKRGHVVFPLLHLQ
ncbi:uncharacterized protein LOC144114879 [Amblyomma americanum]